MVGLFSIIFIHCPRSSKSQNGTWCPRPYCLYGPPYFVDVGFVKALLCISDALLIPYLFVPITVDFAWPLPGCYHCWWPMTVPTRIEQVYYYGMNPNFQWALLCHRSPFLLPKTCAFIHQSLVFIRVVSWHARCHYWGLWLLLTPCVCLTWIQILGSASSTLAPFKEVFTIPYHLLDIKLGTCWAVPLNP